MVPGCMHSWSWLGCLSLGELCCGKHRELCCSQGGWWHAATCGPIRVSPGFHWNSGYSKMERSHFNFLPLH